MIWLRLFLTSILTTAFGMPVKTAKPPVVVPPLEPGGMTECEHSLHYRCAMTYGTKSYLSKPQCDPAPLQACLAQHLHKDACAVKDPDTLSVIEQLQRELKKRAAKKKCADQRFLLTVKSYFKVLGALSDERADYIGNDYSGSGGQKPDDNEPGDVNDDVIGETETGVINKKDSNYWQKHAKTINVLKRRVPYQHMAFFEPTDVKKNDITSNRVTSNDVTKKKNKDFVKVKKRRKDTKNRGPLTQEEIIAKAWENLVARYTRWLKTSKYYNTT